MCRSITVGTDIDAIGAINSVMKLTINTDVLFDVARYVLKENAKHSLDSLAQNIQKIDKAIVVIKGHTDSDGETIYNMELSRNRCISLKNRLLEIFSENSLHEFEIKPYGHRRPRVPNDSDEHKQQK